MADVTRKFLNGCSAPQRSPTKMAKASMNPIPVAAILKAVNFSLFHSLFEYPKRSIPKKIINMIDKPTKSGQVESIFEEYLG